VLFVTHHAFSREQEGHLMEMEATQAPKITHPISKLAALPNLVGNKRGRPSLKEI
jgi:hypothetical protein